jgi:hypothetical protein
MASGEAVADGVQQRRAPLRPVPPGDAELVLWQGRPQGMRRLFETLALALLLGLLTWLAVTLVRPHLAGSEFAGNPDAGAVPLIIAMLIGMLVIIALPVWLRSSARARAHYMLTNRRALVWLGDRIVGEAMLFGCTVALGDRQVTFSGTLQWLDWRLKDENADRLRFEAIADAAEVAAIAERQGAHPGTT